MPAPATPEDLSVTPALTTEAIPALLGFGRSHAVVASRRGVEVVAGSGLGLSSETTALKQRRLRAAATFFLATLVTLLAWRLAVGISVLLLALHTGVLAIMATVYFLLSDSRPLTAGRLTALEMVTFAIMALFLAVRQYDAMISASLTEQYRAIQVATKNTLIGSMILIFAYAMLIPNAWRRAAWFVMALVFVPLTTQTIVYAIHPEVFRLVRRDHDLALFSENIVFATIAAGLAIYGTRVINTLRIAAFEARQLNQYKLGEHLGTGGMGEVFRAEHKMLKRPCAIKLIKPDRSTDAVALARFEREVRATARLSHPHTIEIYDYGHTEDGTFYYVMELLRGLSLAELIEQFGPMPASRVVRLLKPTCEALAEAHAAGLVHRDLKPANIFAAYRGGRHDVAKLLDFGLVKGGEDAGSPELSREGTVRGTPHYMAPEQAVGGGDLDARCDLYAVGGVAFCLLTGRPPFEGDTAARVMIAHVRDPVLPPSTFNSEVPEDLEAIVLKCLEKRREDRYPNALMLAEALGACECAAEWGDHQAGDWWDRNAPGR